MIRQPIIFTDRQDQLILRSFNNVSTDKLSQWMGIESKAIVARYQRLRRHDYR